MDPDLSGLDAYLEDIGVDGYLIHAASTDANQYYLSGFDAPDPFLTLYDGSVHLLPRGLEYSRAKSESRAETVSRYADYDYRELATKHGPTEARDRVFAAFLADRGVGSVAAPERFPLGIADGLRERGVAVAVDEEDAIGELRARKTDAEVEHIRDAQRATETAMARAEGLIADATVEDGLLIRDGDVLTSEWVTRAIETSLLEQGYALEETIVACGSDAADPHDRGSGPLAVGESIVVDIFPQSKASKYHADMTRTFCRGEPGNELREWYELTDAALEAALSAVEPGATGAAVHDAACEVYEQAGLPTLRTDETAETGFIHSTGHGVGLEVHERPSVGRDGPELAPGHVITIEPGLYDPAVGGVRIEDLVVVTEDGFENLTDYEKQLVV